MVGPRVALQVLETLHEVYPERFPLFATLANYADGRDEIAVAGDGAMTEGEVLDGALAAIADEVEHLLAEGVVPAREDVDTALILGAGFPFWLGGITKYLEQTGIAVMTPSR
jgi:3-hydroxyacyl-CoA dehydrogenase